MVIGDKTTSGAELLEVSERVFPQLGSNALEYVKFKVPSPFAVGDFWIVYYVKGYGEYVLEINETDFCEVQRYLIYSEIGNSTVGTKPDWFDNFF